LQAGQKVLVLGGVTAVGSIAIQLAKQIGAFVATTGSTNKMPDGMSKIDFLKKLGSDVVIDYRVDDWAEVLAGQDYDLIFDCVGDMQDWDKCAPVLKRGGFFVSTANFGQVQQLDGPIFKVMMVTSNAEDLSKLVTHVETGAIKVPIDSIVSFEAAREGIAKSLKGQASGKIIVDVLGPSTTCKELAAPLEPVAEEEEVQTCWRPGQGRLRRHLRNALCFGRGK
jgi:NADPH:quinone reductase-like Zn-dependent oxidoreductase